MRWILVLVLLLITPVVFASDTAYTITGAFDDNWMDEANNTTNNGTDDDLKVGATGLLTQTEYRISIRWNDMFDSLNSDRHFDTLDLNLVVAFNPLGSWASDDTLFVLAIHNGKNWSEATSTWDNYIGGGAPDAWTSGGAYTAGSQFSATSDYYIDTVGFYPLNGIINGDTVTLDISMAADSFWTQGFILAWDQVNFSQNIRFWSEEGTTPPWIRAAFSAIDPGWVGPTDCTGPAWVLSAVDSIVWLAKQTITSMITDGTLDSAWLYLDNNGSGSDTMWCSIYNVDTTLFARSDSALAAGSDGDVNRYVVNFNGESISGGDVYFFGLEVRDGSGFDIQRRAGNQPDTSLALLNPGRHPDPLVGATVLVADGPCLKVFYTETATGSPQVIMIGCN